MHESFFFFLIIIIGDITTSKYLQIGRSLLLQNPHEMTLKIVRNITPYLTAEIFQKRIFPNFTEMPKTL